jgi:DNA-binding transcriptional LysR family regulator
MDLKHLNTFRMIASLCSFNQAADMLEYAQSTVSEHIKVLEAELGAKLFKRTGKGISLTPAGELFLQYAQTMLDLGEEVRTKIQGCDEVRGSLSIRIPETIGTYYLPSTIKAFRCRFPRVDFHFTSCSSHGLHEELSSGIINLAFLIDRDFRDAALETQTLMEVPLALMTYPANPLAEKSRVRPIDLKNEPVFVTSSDCSYFKILEELFVGERVRFSTLYHLNSIGAIKRNMAAGTGVALLPRISVREEMEKGLLVELPLEKERLSANILMIRMKNKWHPQILDAFMETMKQSLSSAEGAAES